MPDDTTMWPDIPDEWIDALSILWEAHNAPDLAAWDDADLTRIFAATELLGPVLRALNTAAKDAVVENHQIGFKVTTPGIGTVRVRPETTTRHDWPQFLTVLAHRTFQIEGDELPVTVRTYINQIGQVLPSGAKFKVTEIDALGIARNEVIVTDTKPTTEYTPPKGT